MRAALLIVVMLATIAVSAFAADAPLPPEPRLVPDAPRETVTAVFEHQDRVPVELEGRRLAHGTDLMYVTAAGVERVFRAGRFWDPEERRLRLRLGGHECTLTADSRLVRVDGEDRLLTVPVRALDGDLWLPVTLLVEVLPSLTGEPVRWDPDAAMLTVGGSRPGVEALEVRVSGRATHVRLACREPLSWRLERGPGNKATLRIHDAAVDAGNVRRDRSRGLVRRVRSRQDGRHAVVEVSHSPLVSRLRSHAEDGGRTIVLVLEESASSLPSLPARGQADVAEPDAFRADDALDVVVIDPGHGGDDRGLRAHEGDWEADLVLDAARDLRDALKDRGFSVVLTREGGRGLEPDERAERANLVGGDLFISLHVGAWFDDEAAGISAWYLAATPGAVDDDPLAFVAWDRVQQRHLARSADAARVLAAGAAGGLGLLVLSVDQANLAWLQGVDMPAVVLELGQISNEDDRRRLEDGRDRARLADALADAVVDLAAMRDGPADDESDVEGGDER